MQFEESQTQSLIDSKIMEFAQHARPPMVRKMPCCSVQYLPCSINSRCLTWASIADGSLLHVQQAGGMQGGMPLARPPPGMGMGHPPMMLNGGPPPGFRPPHMGMPPPGAHSMLPMCTRAYSNMRHASG